MLSILRRTIAPPLALTLCIALPTQSVYAQNWCPPEPRKKSTSRSSATEQQSTRYRMRSVRGLGPTQALASVRASERRDIVLLPAGLLTSNALIAALKESRAMFAVIDGPGSVTVPSQLNQAIEGVSVLAAAPTTEAAIRSVYRDEAIVTPQTARQAARIAKTIGSVQDAKLLTADSTTQVLREARRTDTKELFLVLAHSEGGTLYFPDGTSLPIATVHETLRASKRPGLIISCETIDQQGSGIATAKRIDFEAAARAAHAARGARSVGEFVDTFARAYQSPRDQVRQRAIVIGSSLGMLILFFILTDDDD